MIHHQKKQKKKKKLVQKNSKTHLSRIQNPVLSQSLMEGALFPNGPVPPIPTNRPTKPLPNLSLKFTSTTLPLPPLPPQSPQPSSVPLDTLLQHLFHLSSPPITTATHRKLKPLHPPRYTNHNTNTQFPSFHISAQLDHKQVHHKARSTTNINTIISQILFFFSFGLTTKPDRVRSEISD